jgi:serine/threonine-protein kinase
MYEAGAIVTLTNGQYRLCEQLACSAYGVVWRADAAVGGPVALKLVNRVQMARAEPALRGRWIECAATEIAFLRGLAPWDERHIVRLLDSGEHEALPAMALELLDGDLARRLGAEQAAGRAVALAQALDWIAQVNQGLAKVHQYGWRYLDLKPGNLLYDASKGAVKLGDFGTTRPLADLAPHSYAGTAGWQAPEQFFPRAAYGYETDERTDYFALGALFYYLVAGQPLRFASACGDAYRAHGSGAAAFLRQRHGGAAPQVLQADEAATFVRCAERQAAVADPGAAASSSLLLLRALLAPRRDDRPRHALDISRMIEAARAALRAGGLRNAA